MWISRAWRINVGAPEWFPDRIIPGALWSRALIEETRWPVHRNIPDLVRIVVAIDPAVSTGEDADETGFGLRPWRPRVGSVLKHRALTAAVIDSRDYLAARRRAETELRIPPGTRIAFTGGMDCNDHLDRRALRRGDAKSRKARSLIGKNRPAG